MSVIEKEMTLGEKGYLLNEQIKKLRNIRKNELNNDSIKNQIHNLEKELLVIHELLDKKLIKKSF